MINVRRYTPADKERWNHFLASAKNGTFLFDRNFMDYHADRFVDHSLIFTAADSNNDAEILALFPANHVQATSEIISHGGLTYGGLVLSPDARLQAVLQIMRTLLYHYHSCGFEAVVYKQIPSFYHTVPAFEEEYALFLAEAALVRRDTGFVIDTAHPLPFQQRRIRSIKKAVKSGVELHQTNTHYNTFWNDVLAPNLADRHGTKPVHSLQEITMLAECFPQNIKLHTATLGGTVVAGVVVFETPTVAHTQYISANNEGRISGAIDHLFSELIHTYYRHTRYFSFGITNELQGLYLNEGLTDWKEGFGSRTWSHNFYRMQTKHYALLEQRFSEWEARKNKND